MLSLLLVLGAIVAAANIVSWNGIVRNADAILGLLAENGGSFPDRMRDFVRNAGTAESFGQSFAESGKAPDDMTVPRDPEPPFGGRRGYERFSEETAFENRYFSVRLDSSGAVVSSDTANIAAVTGSEAAGYALEAYKSGAERGFRDNYRFLRSDSDGGVLMIFLDRTRDIETFRDFLKSSVLISLAGFLAVLLLITLLSARIVKPISDSYEKQKRFITDAGHEIKTPLTIINADADVLEMEIGVDNEWIGDIKKQTKRLAGLTSDLIYLAKMEESSAMPQAKMTEFPVSDIAAECAQSFAGIARSKGKNFEVDISPGLSMKGDEKAVAQLIGTLLDNAMKYSPDGGSVSFRLKASGRNIALSVSNEADKMSKEDIKHLFDRFYRADRSRSSKTGGSGIGLSVAHAIVSAHKGRISAAQDENGVFTVTAALPV